MSLVLICLLSVTIKSFPKVHGSELHTDSRRIRQHFLHHTSQLRLQSVLLSFPEVSSILGNPFLLLWRLLLLRCLLFFQLAPVQYPPQLHPYPENDRTEPVFRSSSLVASVPEKTNVSRSCPSKSRSLISAAVSTPSRAVVRPVSQICNLGVLIRRLNRLLCHGGKCSSKNCVHPKSKTSSK